MSQPAPQEGLKAELDDVKFASTIANLVMVLSVLVLLFEIGRWVYEFLRYGEVTTVAVATFFEKPEFDWVGVQRITNFLWELGISWIALAFGVISGFSSDYYRGKQMDLQRQLAQVSRQA